MTNAINKAVQSGPIIRLRDLSYAYDKHIALRRISMEIMPGEAVAFMGPNGCGKTTLIRLLNGLLEPAEGTYHFKGDRVDKAFLSNARLTKRFHQQVGYVFQDSEMQLFCSSVRDEIAFGPIQMGFDDEKVEQRTDDMLKLIGIEHLADRAPYHLSGGEKRKVALASILAMNPSVLILDEPLAGLDQKTQEWLLGFLKELKAAGRTLIFSTHDPVLASELADTIYTLTEEHRLASTTE